MKFLKAFLYSALSLIVLKYGLIIAIDPYRVFKLSDFNKKNFTPNAFFTKVQHLKSHNYEGYILGTSRANSYRSKKMKNVTGLSYYNLSSLNFKLKNIKSLLEWLVKEKGEKAAQEIIITLDYDLMFEAYELPFYPIQILPPPEVADVTFFDFYSRNLSISFSTIFDTVTENFKKDVYYVMNLETGNYNEFTDKDNTGKGESLRPGVLQFDWVKEVEEKIRKEDWEKIDISCFRPSDTPAHQKALALFHEVNILANRFSKKVIYLVSPLLEEKRFNLENYAALISWLVKEVGPLWHFGAYNHHALSKIYYYDNSHFDFYLADKVIDRMNNKPTDGFEDFGTYVNRDTLKQFLEMLIKKAFIRHGRRCG